MTPNPLDRRTLETVIGGVGLQLAELERRNGQCALCHSAELRRHLDYLRLLLKEATKQQAR